MFGFGRSNNRVKEASQAIAQYISSTYEFGGISFDKIVERDYCAFISDELNSYFKKSFGGDYESSITFRYSDAVGLAVEVYFSTAKARFVGGVVPSLVASAVKEDDLFGNISYDLTRFIPGESALTFTVTADMNGNDFPTMLIVLGGIVGNVAAKLQ